MEKRLFRYLKPEEIEIRKGSFIGKDKDRVELLPYKTARTDYALLDETFGPFNWAVQYVNVNGGTYCGIGIRETVTGQMVWKYNAGHVSEDTTDYTKALASDACKRAGFAWGLGVELYGTPRVVVPNENTSYKCTEFECEDGKVTKYTIVDGDGEQVFHYEPGYTSVRSGKTEYPEEDKSLEWSARLRDWCGKMKESTEDPDTHTLLLAFYYANQNMSQRGEKYGCAQLWKWLKKDIKDGRTILDDTNPRHPQLIKK